jgi:hypothetical protein
LWIAKAILSKMSNPGDIIIPDFKLYYRAIIIKTDGMGTKTDMKTNEIKRKNTDTDPHNYSHLIFHR